MEDINQMAPQQEPTNEVWHGSEEMPWEDFVAVIDDYFPGASEEKKQAFGNLLNQQIPDWSEWDDLRLEEMLDAYEKAEEDPRLQQGSPEEAEANLAGLGMIGE